MMNSRTVLGSSIRGRHLGTRCRNHGFSNSPCYVVPRRLTVRGLFLRRTTVSDVRISRRRVVDSIREHAG